jgi:hypothetical protein
VGPGEVCAVLCMKTRAGSTDGEGEGMLRGECDAMLKEVKMGSVFRSDDERMEWSPTDLGVLDRVLLLHKSKLRFLFSIHVPARDVTAVM